MTKILTTRIFLVLTVLLPGGAFADGKPVDVNLDRSDVTTSSFSGAVGAGPIYGTNGLRGYGLKGSAGIPLVMEDLGSGKDSEQYSFDEYWRTINAILLEPGVKGTLEFNKDKKIQSHSLEVSVGSVFYSYREDYSKRIQRLTREMEKRGITQEDVSRAYDSLRNLRQKYFEKTALDQSVLEKRLQKVHEDFEMRIEDKAKVNPIFKRIRDGREKYRELVQVESIEALKNLEKENQAVVDEFNRSMKVLSDSCPHAELPCQGAIEAKKVEHAAALKGFEREKRMLELRKTEIEGERDDALRAQIPEYDRHLKEEQKAFRRVTREFKAERAALSKEIRGEIKRLTHLYQKAWGGLKTLDKNKLKEILSQYGDVKAFPEFTEDSPYYARRLDLGKLSYVNRKGDILPGAGQHGARVEGLSYEVRTGVAPGGIPMNVCALVSPAGLLLGQQKSSTGRNLGVAYQAKLGGCLRAQVGKVGTLSEDLSGEFTMPLSSHEFHLGDGKSHFFGDVRLTNRVGVKNILGTPLEVGYETQWEHEWDQGKKNSATTHMLTVGAGIE